MSHRITTRRTPAPIKAFAVALAATLTLSACAAGAPATTAEVEPAASQSAADALVRDHGFAGMEARAIIDQLDALPRSERAADLFVSIRPHELVLTDAQQRETILPMPDDEFYVSIAPYQSQTHDCYFHSLTTCTGEIHNADVHVFVTDSDSGEILIDETRSTFDNGFVGLWLPRDIDATVAIEYDGRSAQAELSTRHDDDATCVTTMQLT